MLPKFVDSKFLVATVVFLGVGWKVKPAEMDQMMDRAPGW
jgi:hypothetical protein